MDVHASPAALPELEAFLSTFKVRFRRREAKAALERYLMGLLTELPNVRDHRVNSFKINGFIFDILPYEFVSH